MNENKMNLNEYAAMCHAANKKWWQNIDTGEPLKRNKKELLALALSEISEALEGERKGLMDDKLPHRKMAEVEMADTWIRLCDFAAGFGYELDDDTKGLPACENKGESLFNISSTIVSCASFFEDHNALVGGQISFALISIRNYCDKFGYDLYGAIEEKMNYNKSRIDHTHEARKIAGGKQF